MITEIAKHLYIGDAQDYETLKVLPEWYFVQACKEPYHREAVGYTTKAAPKGGEYLFVRRFGRLILNMVDSPDPKYVNKDMIAEALNYIHDHIDEHPILVHCNKGESRSACIVMLYLLLIGKLSDKFEEAERQFAELYPPYKPSAGVRGFMSANWKVYTQFKV